jgi:peptidoglycan/xylan/chitin deacetylase (PgdA/CDA1 family)
VNGTQALRSFRRRSRHAALAVATSLVTLTVGWIGAPTPAAHAATPTTIVTIGFDDGTLDQFDTLPVLQAHGMSATFFINTGPILAGDAAHMTVAQLTDLYNAGNDIAGHTVDHANIQPLSTADARAEVCTDRNTLLGWGFQPTSFAYPFGSYDAASETVVHDCGYNSGRGVSGVDDRKTFAETIPPADPYATRTPANVKSGTTLDTIESYVTEAEQHGGGWVQIVFHHVCDHCDAYSVTVADFQALLNWLQPRASIGTVVETTTQVIGGPVHAPVAP